ncbi:allantoin permease [Gordonia desulfuricans]|uniref:Allantoin permease n=1 Tax=Gordonia desulfuricans TaxID=89051 RepID=A0A7K3LJC0_9ACTN|nr:allantoin permease [Gordonia desulfuricans]NDK88161.1 allantoin permease [Gordonia desulfuricans]
MGTSDAHMVADDPAEAAALANDFANQRVPLKYRMSARSLAGAWWAFASAMFWLIFAALVAETVGTKDALIGMGLSVVAYGLINWLISIYAARTGTTVNIFSTALFGKVGGLLAPLLLAVTAIWFATLEGSVIAVAFKQFFGFWDIRIWYLIVVLYSVPLVIGSVRTFLDKFNRYLLPFYIAGLTAAVLWTIIEHGYSNDWLRHEGAVHTAGGPGWIWAFTAFMGDWVLMMATWDYARFGRPERKQERINGVYSFGPVFYFFTIVVNGLVGIFVAFTIPTDGPLNEASAVIGIVSLMGFWGLLLVWISQTRINTANFFLAATNLQNTATGVLGLAVSRRVWVVVVGVVVYLVMLSNVLTFIVQALAYQALFTVTWTAVVVVRIVWGLFRDRRADDVVDASPQAPVPTVRWFGLIGWLSGAAVGCLMLALGGQASAAWTWALPSALAISCVVYGSLLELAYRRRVQATDLVIPA